MKGNKNKSLYELEERLDCLLRMKHLVYEYRHVFNIEHGEPIVNMLERTIKGTTDELERREI